MRVLDEDQFKDPPQRYRPVPFWSLNDHLEDGELKRQIESMKSQGLNGFFMHARVGLVTPYLSDEWMRRIGTCVAHAKALGMNAWIYDEFHCPSGSAKGRVLEQNPDLTEMVLVCTDNPRGQDVLTTFLDQCEKTWFLVPSPVGFNYVNNLLSVAAREFISITHDAYAERFRSEFGTTIRGVFTDEPRYPLYGITTKEPVSGWSIPWSSNLPRIFFEHHGYELLPKLGSMFFPIGDFRRTRHDFVETLTRLFVNNYSRQIFEWCTKKGIIFTGHMAGEDTFSSQIKYVGSAMRHYEFMHIPGIDQLTNAKPDVVSGKQVSSVAHQLGRHAMAEAFGASGWSMTPQDLKRIANYLFVLGINLLVPHIMHYSLRGLRKRDWPPSLFFQQAWWPFSRTLWIYLSRLSYALLKGRPVGEVLVIHPIRTAWSMADPTKSTYDPSKEVNILFSKFEKLSQGLMRYHVEYDYGDEHLISRHGRVEGKHLIVGHRKYSVVILPFCSTIHSDTVRILRAFGDSGGKIIILPPSPDLFVGADTATARKDFKETEYEVMTESSLLEALVNHRTFNFEPERPGTDLWVMSRSFPAARLLFITNTNWRRRVAGTARLSKWRKYRRWDPETGEVSQTKPLSDGILDLELLEGDSLLVTLMR